MLQVQVTLKVRETAQLRGITRARLSRLADVAPGTINNIWRNEHHEVYLTTLARIAYALHVPLQDLYQIEIVEIAEPTWDS